MTDHDDSSEIVDRYLSSLEDGVNVTLRELCDEARVDVVSAERALATKVRGLLENLGDSQDGSGPVMPELDDLEFVDPSQVLEETRHSGLGRYELGMPIREGKDVYRAWDRHLATSSVVKRYTESENGSGYPTRAEAVRTFMAEARTTAGLQHPAVPPVHAVGVDDDGQPWYSMTFVDGQSFDEVLEDASQGRVSSGRVLQFVQQIAEAIAYVHKHHRLVHCDVKPDNIVVGRFGRVHVLDWGSACPIGGVPRQGTPGYLSRAQAEARPSSPHYDVYAVGALIRDLIHRVPATSVDVQLIRDRALGDATQPYASMDDLLRDLGAYLEGRCVTGGTLRRLANWARRQKAAAILVFAVAASALTGLVLFACAVGERRSAMIDAWDNSDPVALVDYARAGGPATAIAASLLPSRLRSAVRRIATDLEHPLLTVKDATRISHRDGLVEAAGFLRLCRVGSSEVEWLKAQTADPVSQEALRFYESGGLAAPVRAFLWRFLVRSAVAELSAGVRDSAVMRLLGRLLLESPDDTHSESAETAAIRMLVVETVPLLPIGSPARMWAIATLGGCGTASEIPWLASLPEVREGPDQLRNPVVSNIANIVGRVHLISETPLTKTQVAGLIRTLERTGSGIGTEGVLRACLAHRFLSRATWGREVVEPLADKHGPTIDLMFDLSDKRSARVNVMRGRYDVYPSLLGFACAMLQGVNDDKADRDLLRVARDQCDPIFRLAFDAAVESGLRLKLHGEYVFELVEPLDRGSFLMPRAWLTSVPTDEPVPCKPGSDDQTVASWNFQVRDPAYSGTATGHVTVVESRFDPESSCWRLTRANRSRLTVEFVVKGTGRSLILILRHLAASRTSMPWEGSATIQIELDGGVWQERLKVFETGGHEAMLRIPHYWLEPGKHRLTVRLVENTTTYWIENLALRDG